MPAGPLPAQACWRHTGLREGFEVLLAATVGGAQVLRGSSTGIEDGVPWSVLYDIETDDAWRTRTARVRLRGRDGEGEVLLERDDRDRWSVDGLHRPELDGIRDVDLEASTATNALPLHRIDLTTTPTSVPAVWVRLDLRVQRLAQTYALAADGREPDGHDQTGATHRVAYEAPALGFAATLDVDASGLVVTYPGLAVRYA